MKKAIFISLILALAILFCSCSILTPIVDPTSTGTNEVPSSTATATSPSTDATATAPQHSDIYLPKYTVTQIIKYFKEIVLNMEFTDNPDAAALVQKWMVPINYRIYGQTTDEDMITLNTLFAQLNEVDGFPGIYEAEEGAIENLSIYFMDRAGFNESFANVVHGEDAYGAAQFWYYTATNDIHTGRIGYRTDLAQEVRTSVILEEIINVLGISDTVLRPNSIVYQYSDANTELSNVDWVIVKLLYNRAIECGMNTDQCTKIIKELYY